MMFTNKVGFTIGTGRCGTLFLYQVMEKEPDVASSHERNPENEAFQRYCKWHRLPVDDEGFLAIKEREVRGDLEQRAYSFEASPYLALSVRELHERLGAKFVFLIRRPDGVVTSFVHKGFYSRPYSVQNLDLAAGYQDQSPERFFTFFARISPRGEFFRAWNEMTPVGKVAWFWKAYNERTLEALEQLPPESYRLVRIEDLDYPKYKELTAFLGIDAKVSQADFDALRGSMVGAGGRGIRKPGSGSGRTFWLSTPGCATGRRSTCGEGRIDPAGAHSPAEERATILAGAPRYRTVAARAGKVGGRLMTQNGAHRTAALSSSAKK